MLMFPLGRYNIKRLQLTDLHYIRLYRSLIRRSPLTEQSVKPRIENCLYEGIKTLSKFLHNELNEHLGGISVNINIFQEYIALPDPSPLRTDKR